MPVSDLEEGSIQDITLPFTKPLVIRGGCDDMPALRLWSGKYGGDHLKEHFRDAKLEAEVYESFDDFETSKSELQSMKFSEYYDRMFKENIYIPDASLLNLTTPRVVDGEMRMATLDEEMLNDLQSDKLLENYDILMTIPVDYYFFCGVDTKTGNHIHIEDDYLTCQVVGEKEIWLTDYEHFNIKGLFNTYNNFSKENFFQLLKEDKLPFIQIYRRKFFKKDYINNLMEENYSSNLTT